MHRSVTTSRGESFALPSAGALPAKQRICLVLSLAVVVGFGQLEMKRQALIGLGTKTGPGKLQVMDSDHDGLGEICYASWDEENNHRLWGIMEYRPVNSYELVQADTGYYSPDPIIGNLTPFAAADLDQDGLTEIWGEIPFSGPRTRQAWVCAVESQDSWSYPHNLDWWLFVDSIHASGQDYWPIADLDKDGLFEIAARSRPGFMVFENSGPDQCSLVFHFHQPGLFTNPRTAWGDFDQNGKMDLVCDGFDMYAEFIFECTGDNQYAMVCSLPTGLYNERDWFTGQDADQNGRPEFFLQSERWQGALTRIALHMLEAVAEHQYTFWLIDSLDVWGSIGIQNSRCVDLDGDGFEELVFAAYTQVQVKKPRGPHDFETVYTWINDHGRPTTITAAVDYNRNGYNELYVSNNYLTSMLEVEAVRVLQPDSGEEFVPGETCWVVWQTFDPPRCDSVSVFLLTDTVVPEGEWFCQRTGSLRFWNLDTIVTGLAPGDTTYPWVVPDTVLEAAWIVVIAYGPGWQFDRSDHPFQILPVGLAERPKAVVASPLPEPTIVGDVLVWSATTPSLRNVGDIALQSRAKLLDAAGRIVMELRPGPNDVRHLAPGVYFIRGPETEDGRPGTAVRKIVIRR